MNNVSSNWQLKHAANPDSLILVTLMMKVIRSSETSALAKITRRNIPEDGILQLTFVSECIVAGSA
jgi:hypothetical protein